MYGYLLRTLSIQISKTKLLVKMASESRRFANLTEEDLQKLSINKDSKQTKAVIRALEYLDHTVKTKNMFSQRLKSMMILNCPVSCESFTLKFTPNQVIIMPRIPCRQ